MEITRVPCLFQAKPSNCSSTSLLITFLFDPKKKSCLFASSSVSLLQFRSSTPTKSVGIGATRVRNLGAINASASESPSSPAADAADERWLLEPVGDGDTRHIGFQVEMPTAFEIASNDITVGRVPGKADMVIPVATVSGVHARIQKKGGYLLVTDLDSTNGTFIDDKRLRPGAVATVSSGTCITFGDTHLAMFRAFKLEPAIEPPEEQTQDKAETESTDRDTEEAAS